MDANELEVEYPCRWQFTLFGKDEAALRNVVEREVGDAGALTVSKRSAKGTYLSMLLEVEVASDAERRSLWERLAADPAVMHLL